MEATIVSLVLTPVVEKIFEVVNTLVTKEFHKLLGIEDDIRDLSSQLTAIQAVLQDAEEKQLDSAPIRGWLVKLQEALYDAEDILEALQTEALLSKQTLQQEGKTKFLHRPTVSFPNAAPSHYLHKSNAAQEIKKVLARLVKIGEEKQNFQLAHVVHVDHSGMMYGSSSSSHHESRQTGFVVDESDVVGRDDDKEKLIDLLLSEQSDRDGDLSVVPIIGMGGLGKTTLAQLIYNDERVKNHFEFKMWVCVTHVFSYTKILKDIIEFHTEFVIHNLPSLSVAQLESRISEFLFGKPFLLILDDVWRETFKWSDLHKLLKLGGKGCRVLVTSRSKTVSNLMGTLPPYFLELLPEDQCWSLFEKLAFDQRAERSEDLMKIGRDIVRKCNGLPLAIRAMGTLLRGNKDARKWANILKHEIWEAEMHSDSSEPQILPALRLSYNHLPTHLKRCFAFCCVYPKAYVFHKMDLIKVWKAASLILPRGQYTPDDIGMDYFDALLSRSFFQRSQVENQVTFRMHDLHHDLAVAVSGPYCYQIQQNDRCNFSEKTRHISLLCDAVQQPIMEVLKKSKKLRTLLSPTDNPKNFGPALKEIFRTLKYIRILDLSTSGLQELPESVGELKLLHYLDLSKTEIRSIPESIGNLVNLETLRLLGCCWLFQLPKNLARLTNLQHLELDDMFWHKLRRLPPRIGTITGLQNLHAFPVSQEAGHGINELKNMLHLKGALHIKQLEGATNAGDANLKDKEALVNVTLEWSNRDGFSEDEAAHERILEDLQPHPGLEAIQIIHYQGNLFPSWMTDGLVKSLVSVSLHHCINCKVLSLAQLPHLQTLNLKGNLELEEWIDAPYPFVHRLKISNCPKLRSVPQSFPNLGGMKLKKCNSLKTLPLIPSVRFLILIDNLVLEDFNETILLLVHNQRQFAPVMKHSFIQLLELKVINCPKLPSFPEAFAPQKLEVSGCPLMTTLPAPQFSKRFQHLGISAYNDATLVRRIPTTNSLYSLVISNISNLTSVPKWPHLPGLKTLYISGCQDLVSLSTEEAASALASTSASTSTSPSASLSPSPFEGMNSLELLSVRDCPKLVSFAKVLPTTLKCLIISSNSSLRSIGPEDIVKNLASLKDLYIENCPEIQSLPEEGFPASLQHLKIEGCPALSPLCQKDSGEYWPKIQHIADLEIETVKIETVKVPSAPDAPSTSSPWYRRRFICCKGGTNKNQDRQ